MKERRAYKSGNPGYWAFLLVLAFILGSLHYSGPFAEPGKDKDGTPAPAAKPDRAAVSIITSGNAQPYTQALDGIKKLLKEKEKQITAGISEYNLEDEGAKDSFLENTKLKRPDIIFTIGSNATKFAQENIRDIPIVFNMTLTPEIFTAGNIAGVTLNIPSKATLTTLKRVLPKAEKVGLVYSEKTARQAAEIAGACTEMEIQLISRKINSEKDLPDAFEGISGQADCFWMIPDASIFSSQSMKYVLEKSLKMKLAVIGFSSPSVDRGALFSLDCDYEDIGAQSAELGMKILAGKKPIGLENSSQDKTLIEAPRKTRLSLSLIVADLIGVEIPKEVIKEAYKVYEK